MNIALRPDLEKFVREKIQGGEYDSADEVVEAGLRRLMDEQAADDELDDETIAAIGRRQAHSTAARASRWTKPSHAAAQALRPMTRPCASFGHYDPARGAEATPPVRLNAREWPARRLAVAAPRVYRLRPHGPPRHRRRLVLGQGGRLRRPGRRGRPRVFFRTRHAGSRVEVEPGAIPGPSANDRAVARGQGGGPRPWRSCRVWVAERPGGWPPARLDPAAGVPGAEEHAGASPTTRSPRRTPALTEDEPTSMPRGPCGRRR